MLWTPTAFSTAREDHAESTHGYCQWLEKWPHDLFLTNKTLGDMRQGSLGEPLRKFVKSLKETQAFLLPLVATRSEWIHGTATVISHRTTSPRTKPTLKMAQQREGKGLDPWRQNQLPDSSLPELAVGWDYQFPYYVSHLNQGFSVTCSPKLPNWTKTKSLEKININRRLWPIGCYLNFSLLENESHLVIIKPHWKFI